VGMLPSERSDGVPRWAALVGPERARRVRLLVARSTETARAAGFSREAWEGVIHELIEHIEGRGLPPEAAVKLMTELPRGSAARKRACRAVGRLAAELMRLRRWLHGRP